MAEASAVPNQPPAGTARAALDFVHRLLCAPAAEGTGLEETLRGLAGAFGAESAGVADLVDGKPVLRCRPAGDAGAPRDLWEESPGLPARVLEARTALAVPRPDGGSWLVAAVVPPGEAGWLVFVEGGPQAGWGEAEAGALALAGHALARGLTGAAPRPGWAEALERAARQRRLEAAAAVTRRLAHDFGNVLTGILGFGELSLAQPMPADSTLHRYLTEIHRGAQGGAVWTQQLRLFSRRGPFAARPAALAAAVAEEEARLRPLWGGDAGLRVALPPDLPPVPVDVDHLRRVLASLLDNARDALGESGGSVDVRARVVRLTAADCLERYGDLRPGLHVEVTVADNGHGLSSEARQKVFAEPFFTTRPRRRGLGLMTAYGILFAHRGGLRLEAAPGGGTLARFAVPVAESATAAPPVAPSALEKSCGERVLVVDDDPLILHFVGTTLERAGYRVHAVASAEEALASYAAARPEPFRLVLADVAMPRVGGVELARRLFGQDGEVRVLFMSGQAAVDFPSGEFSGQAVDLLAKPFRPEGLLRAVRAALDRPRRGRGSVASRPSVISSSR